MADDNKSNDKDKNPKGGEFRLPPKTWIVWIAIIASLVTLVMMKGKLDNAGTPDLYSEEFLQRLDSNLVATASVLFNPQTHPVEIVEGTYYKTDATGKKMDDTVRFRTKI